MSGWPVTGQSEATSSVVKRTFVQWAGASKHSTWSIGPRCAFAEHVQLAGSRGSGRHPTQGKRRWFSTLERRSLTPPPSRTAPGDRLGAGLEDLQGQAGSPLEIGEQGQRNSGSSGSSASSAATDINPTNRRR